MDRLSVNSQSLSVLISKMKVIITSTSYVTALAQDPVHVKATVNMNSNIQLPDGYITLTISQTKPMTFNPNSSLISGQWSHQPPSHPG